MSILFSGDFHASLSGEIAAITKKNLLKKYGRKKYNDIKYQIILGDGGFLWPGNQKADMENYKKLARRSFPVLCVIGNHEPMLGMDDTPEADIGIGEKVLLVNKEYPFIAYLKRGKVYTIDGIKFLVLGGAMSIDKNIRLADNSWWKREYWTESEKRDVFKLLETDHIFDCILSHTGPHRINKILFQHQSFIPVIDDKVAFLNEIIDIKIKCREWWCGHWHRDLYFYSSELNRGYQYLYRTTKILDRMENSITVYNEYNKADRQG
ncbi:MAG: metallophosphoesterase [Treponema sp.]|jgi:3-oxoacid CoA-transferase subunit A|nr:metallophosphoesterase [Treponema sp.]